MSYVGQMGWVDMNLRLRVTPAIGVLILALCSCAPGKSSFLIVQLCLENKEGLKDFTERLRWIARSEQMEFVDDSSYVRRELDQAGPIIHLEVDRGDGLGLTATNMGLPGYQVGIGFTEGANPPEGHAFAKRVVDQLKTRWQVLTVPTGRGAFPLKNCVSG